MMLLYILVFILGCDDMDSSYLPSGYKPLLDIRQTQVAIKRSRISSRGISLSSSILPVSPRRSSCARIPDSTIH